MITLTVVSYNGQPSDRGLSARFDELGGTIGRADSNQLVLPDPDRAISRVHAQVVYRNGAYAVIDRGSNPILVNGRPVGSGGEQVLAGGDQVQIGGYLLSVQLQPAGAASSGSSAGRDPFADLLGPAAAAPPARAGQAPSAGWDPLSAYKSEPSPATSPGVYRAPAPPMAAAPASAAGGIPDDWDPFASMAKPAIGGASAAARGADPLGLGLEAGAAAPAPLIPELAARAAPAGDSLDALFGLKAGGGGNHNDPLAGSLLDEAAAQPNMAAHADPLRALQSAPQASSAALPDELSDLNRPFQGGGGSGGHNTQAIPKTAAGAVLSWGQPAEGRTVIRPAARPPESAPMPLTPPAPPAALPTPPRPMPAAPAAPRAAAAPAAGGDALLAAFREGLAMPELGVDQLTPELMRLIGQLLREAAAGTVDLLVARAALKREVRAEATMIVARENNPLKFSPSAEAALQHLLAPPTRGFMAAAPAMRDAFDDLRAHQFGFVAGMRAALAGVLGRFDPEELEGRLTQRSVLASLLPGSRKAALWELFVEHYAQISEEAEDDFHSLFGRAFLQAYEDHIEQLRARGPGG